VSLRVPVQIEEKLPVRIVPGQPVRSVHGQRGLADPGHPVDRRDHHRTRVTTVAPSEGDEPVQFGLPAGEVPRRRGQLPRHHPHDRAAGNGDRRFALAGQDAFVQGTQFGSGLDPELVDQYPAGALIGLQCLRLTAAAGQGQHQLGVEALP